MVHSPLHLLQPDEGAILVVVALVDINTGTSMEYRGERVEVKENQRRN